MAVLLLHYAADISTNLFGILVSDCFLDLVEHFAHVFQLVGLSEQKVGVHETYYGFIVCQIDKIALNYYKTSKSFILGRM